MARYLHIAVVANLSNHVLALHESKISIESATFVGESTGTNQTATAEPIYQRFCGATSHIVPMYSWVLKKPAPQQQSSTDDQRQNSRDRWIISWKAPPIGRSYEIQIQ